MRDYSKWYTMTKWQCHFLGAIRLGQDFEYARKKFPNSIEIFRIKIGELPSIIHEAFKIDDSYNYNLNKNREFELGNPKTVYYGTESISVLGPKLWIILTDEHKNLTSLKESQLRWRIGCLKIAHDVYSRHALKILALFNFS